MRSNRLLVLVLACAVTIGCGGGEGANSGGDNAVSGKVPYLISGPSISFRSSPTIIGRYDVTVTIEADGPTGIKIAYVWLVDETDDSDTQPIDLYNVTGTRRWTGTTDGLLPVASGIFSLEHIILEDGEYPADDPIATGWYFVQPLFSTSMYTVTEKITTYDPATVNLFYGGGLTSWPVTRFTLP